MENGAIAHKACHQEGRGACPPRKILDFKPSEIVSGTIWRYIIAAAIPSRSISIWMTETAQP